MAARSDAAAHDLQVHQIELELQNEELREARAELEGALERLEALYQQAPVGYVTVNDAGVVGRANLRAAELLGRGRAPLAGRRLRTLFPPEGRGTVDALLLALRRGTPGASCVVALASPRLPAPAVKLDGVPAPGGPSGACQITLTDITALMAAQAVLREEDGRLVAFLGVLGHELRNPLAAATTALSILDQAGPDHASVPRARETVGRQLRHLGRLVDDLLDVARITAGKVRLQLAPVRLDELVRAAAEDHRALLASRAIALQVDVPDVAIWASGDAARLAQVVGNLLQNAAKFTPARGRVALSLAAERGSAVVRVADSGVGLVAGDLARIFEPFAQAGAPPLHGATAAGLGLGLALAKQFVGLHGGSMEAASDGPGHGAVFTVRLPLAGPPVLPVTHASPPGGGRAARACRVLVVDDNRDAADSLGELLDLMGHRAEVCHDAEVALSQALEEPPDVVLSDLGLPGMSGHQLARALRSDSRLDATWLVALSGYALPEDLVESARAGFDVHLAKPLVDGQLERLLGACARPRARQGRNP